MLEQIGKELVPVLAVGGGCLVVVIWVIAATVESILKTMMNNRLKVKLVERGFSATEIANVINAGAAVEAAEAEVATVSARPAAPVKAGTAY